MSQGFDHFVPISTTNLIKSEQIEEEENYAKQVN